MSEQMFQWVFTQWQGSGDSNKQLYKSAHAIHAALESEGWPLRLVDVPADEPLPLENNILGYKNLKVYFESACTLLKQADPQKILTIGGDCSIELAPLSFINQKYNGDVAIVWVDAHADLNTSESSPSKKFHGMPLRMLLKDGDEAVISKLFSTITIDQIVMAGIRDIDPPEQEFIDQQNIPIIPVASLNKGPEELIEAVKRTGKKHVHLHVDLDVIDPSEFSSFMCITPGGITRNALSKIITGFGEAFDIVGCTLTEYSSPNTDELPFVLECLRSMKQALK